jgi:hypothetical protein
VSNLLFDSAVANSPDSEATISVVGACWLLRLASS